MPEEKVSTEQLGTCGWDGRADPSYDTSFHQGHHPYRTMCINWAPASAGPRQHVQVERSLMEGIRSFMNRRFDQDRLIKYQDHFIREIDRILAAPPVPQEAAPGIDKAARARLAEHRPSRYDALPATAPDSAMRVAEKLYRDVYQDCDCNHDTSDFDIFKAAALIREAGSEWERVSAPGVSGNVVSVLWPDGTPRELRSSIKQASQLIAMLVSFVNSGESMDDQSNHDIALWRAEASRLLGGN